MPAEATRFPRAGVRYRILGLLALLSFVNYLLRNNLSVVLPSLRTEFHFTTEDLGWIVGAFNFSYALFQIPGGLFGQLVRPRLAMALMAISWGVLTLLTGAAPSLAAVSAAGALWALVVVRLAMGITQAPIFSVQTVSIANWFPVRAWGIANGLASAGLSLGQTAANPLAAILITLVGWRGSFYVLAPVGFGIAAWWWTYARDTPAQHAAVTEAELRLIEGDRPAKLTTGAGLSGASAIFAKRDIWLLAVSYFCLNYVFYFFSNWLVLYLVEKRGFTLIATGFLSMLPFLVGAAMAPLGGLVCDRLSRRLGARWGCRLPVMVGFAIIAVLLFAGLAADSGGVAVALLSLCFGFVLFTDTIYWVAAMHIAGPNTSTACGIMNTGGNLPGMLAPLFGFLVDRMGWTPTVTIGSGVAVMGALLWLGIRVIEPSPRTAQ